MYKSGKKPFFEKFEELIKEEGYSSINSFVDSWISKGGSFKTIHQWLTLKNININYYTAYSKLRPYLTIPYDVPSSFWNKWNIIAEAKGFKNIDDMMETYKKKYTNTEMANELGVTTRTIEYLKIKMDGDRNLPIKNLVKMKRPSQKDEDGFTKTDIKEKWIKLLNEKGFNNLKEAATFYKENKKSILEMAKDLGVTERSLTIRLEKAGILIDKKNEVPKNTEDSLGLL